MRPEERDAAWLWDMLESARDAVEYAGRITFNDLIADEFARYTLSKPLEQIGESASRVSPAFRAAHPEIDWGPIIGFRNRLVHDYRNINFKVAWTSSRPKSPS